MPPRNQNSNPNDPNQASGEFPAFGAARPRRPDVKGIDRSGYEEPNSDGSHITSEQAAAFVDTEKRFLRDQIEKLRQQIRETGSLPMIQDGTIVVHDYRFTPLGLIAPEHEDQQAWEQVGGVLFKLEGAIQWLLGDWLVYGEDKKYGDTKRIAEEWGIDYGTLRNYASVSRSVQLSLRNDKLKYHHHVAVAGLEPHQQLQALEYAASFSGEKKLSVKDFRRWITDTFGEGKLLDAPRPEDRMKRYQDSLPAVARLMSDPRSIERLSPKERQDAAKRLKVVYMELMERLRNKRG